MLRPLFASCSGDGGFKSYERAVFPDYTSEAGATKVINKQVFEVIRDVEGLSVPDLLCCTRLGMLAWYA